LAALTIVVAPKQIQMIAPIESLFIEYLNSEVSNRVVIVRLQTFQLACTKPVTNMLLNYY
jgi:hypothetical protein